MLPATKALYKVTVFAFISEQNNKLQLGALETTEFAEATLY